MPVAEFDSGCMRDLLPIYYGRLFPLNLMHRWLSYGNDETVFPNREFSFTLPGDVYIRYQSFANEEEFGKELKKRVPEKIDIGAVYNMKPKLRDTSGEFQPVQKEFVLDIDLTDYDDVRTCCEGAKVCQDCWKFIGVAVQVLNKALTDDFGFKHLLWVFSGRRGVHCWVADETARFLDNNGRSAVVEYLQVLRGGESQAKKVKLPFERMHPSIRRALQIVENHFDDICLEEQKIFEGELGEKTLEVLPPELRPKIKALHARHASSDECWKAIKAWIHERKMNKDIKNKKTRLLEEIQLQYCYPRLDINVSKGLNHLLKSPFCIHPKTGQVCVPFLPGKVFEFKISEVPSLTEIIEQINEYDAKNPNASNRLDWKKTDLAEYMEVFSEFVKEMEKERKRLEQEKLKKLERERKAQDAEMDIEDGY